MSEPNAYLTAAAFKDHERALQAIRALRDADVTPRQIVLVKPESRHVTAFWKQATELAGPQVDLESALEAIQAQAASDPNWYAEPLRESHFEGDMLFLVSTQVEIASTVVHILVTWMLPGDIIITPPPPPPPKRSGLEAFTADMLSDTNPERPTFAVLVGNSTLAFDAIEGLAKCGISRERIRIAMNDPHAEQGLAAQAHAERVEREASINVEGYMRRRGLPELSASTYRNRTVFNEGGVIIELSPDQAPTEQIIHILSNYALPGGILIPPPPPPKKSR